MDKIDKVTGQRVDHREHNDNAPPRYSAPSLQFKNVLQFHANRYCARCGGTGYIGNFNSTAGGRCFKCIPDQRWEGLLGERVLTGSNDDSQEPVCEIRRVSAAVYPSAGYIVTRLIDLPPIDSPQIFSTIEAARAFASAVYGV